MNTNAKFKKWEDDRNASIRMERAAPDMLAALERIMQEDCEIPEIIDLARAAVAKAKASGNSEH